MVRKERTNLLVMGTLASGSSALIDMLYEYENINVLRYEFNDFRRPGFVSDQLSTDSSISYPNVIDQKIKFTNDRWRMIYNSSIWKMIPDKALDYIWEKEFQNKKLKAYKNSLTELFQIVFLKDLSRSLNSGISYEEKTEQANEWIRRVGSIFPSHYDFTLFNQPLHPWSDPAIWTRVFKPFKLICVYREPKDQLAEMVKRNIDFSPFRCSQLSYGQFNLISIYGNDRKGRLNFLKDAFKHRLEKIDNWLSVIGPDQILFVDFEGLVNNYDVYETRIENFLGNINGRHKFRKKYFNPEVAKKNSIGIYKNWLNEEELEGLSSLEDWYNNKIKLG
jgi:hypothetical protein